MTTRDDAVARVKLLGATTTKPPLDDDQVGLVVDGYALVDVNGVPPGGAGWVAVYDVNGATAEVYRIKAGLVSADYNFQADDAQFSKGDVLAHLLALEAKYAALAKVGANGTTTTGMGAGTIQVVGTTQGYTNQLDVIAGMVIP